MNEVETVHTMMQAAIGGVADQLEDLKLTNKIYVDLYGKMKQHLLKDTSLEDHAFRFNSLQYHLSESKLSICPLDATGTALVLRAVTPTENIFRYTDSISGDRVLPTPYCINTVGDANVEYYTTLGGMVVKVRIQLPDGIIDSRLIYNQGSIDEVRLLMTRMNNGCKLEYAEPKNIFSSLEELKNEAKSFVNEAQRNGYTYDAATYLHSELLSRSEQTLDYMDGDQFTWGNIKSWWVETSIERAYKISSADTHGYKGVKDITPDDNNPFIVFLRTKGTVDLLPNGNILFDADSVTA